MPVVPIVIGAIGIKPKNSSEKERGIGNSR